jgi:hypothetical protein
LDASAGVLLFIQNSFAFLYSTLCHRHLKVKLFPSLSPSQNNQTEVFRQNAQPKTQRHKHVNKTG